MMPQMNLPYLIPLNDRISTVHLTDANLQNLAIPVAADFNSFAPMDQQICFQAVKTLEVPSAEETQPSIVYQVVYPEDLDLKPSFNAKRGRPKRKVKEDIKPPETPVDPPKSARTRSGRLVKLPKHIEKDFKKIEITDEPELKTSEFVRFEENKKENIKLEELENHQRKRIISSQYRCSKCHKAYLGKVKMIQHLQKYPDHGPLSEKFNEINLDVWNYLVDVTQKSPSGKRGNKFCEELTNLLHNVQILTGALFKKEESDNNVHIDKVLGNAIGLNPGKYKFDENELYKDVTVLKLIANSDFFNPNNGNNIFTSEEKLKNSLNEIDSNNKSAINIANQNNEEIIEKKYFDTEIIKPTSDIEFQTDVALDFSFTDSSDVYKKAFDDSLPTLTDDTENIYTFSDKKNDIHPMDGFGKSVKDNSIASFKEKNDENLLVNQMGLHSDLLSENSLLNALPHTSVDEFITDVDSTSNLLDNSIGSDEVMNVDQFVNERFKKITEPDIDLSNGSLNLDLPSLDLFQFNTS